MNTLKTLLVAVGITLGGIAVAQDVPNTPRNIAFCGGVLNAVAVGTSSYAPVRSRQYEDFARDRIDRAASRGLSDRDINYYFAQGFKQMRQDQAKNNDEAFNLMQLCLRL